MEVEIVEMLAPAAQATAITVSLPRPKIGVNGRQGTDVPISI